MFGDQDLQDISALIQGSELKILGVSPNPTSGEVTLGYYLPNTASGVYALIYDMQGRLVDAKDNLSRDKGVSQQLMNLQRLPQGTYILVLKAQTLDGMQYVETTKIIRR